MKTKSAFKSQQEKTDIIEFYDSLLEKTSLSHERLNVNTRYGNTFIIATGDKSAQPLILLHGSATNSLMWLGDAPEYSRNYRVYMRWISRVNRVEATKINCP